MILFWNQVREEKFNEAAGQASYSLQAKLVQTSPRQDVVSHYLCLLGSGKHKSCSTPRHHSTLSTVVSATTSQSTTSSYLATNTSSSPCVALFRPFHPFQHVSSVRAANHGCVLRCQPSNLGYFRQCCAWRPSIGGHGRR